MELGDILESFSIPKDLKGTSAIENLKEKHLCYIGESKFARYVKPNSGAYILVTPSLLEKVKDKPGNEYIVTDTPVKAFVSVHNCLYKPKPPTLMVEKPDVLGKNCILDPSARFGNNVRLGDNVVIYPHVIIGSNVVIGDNTVIYPNASIYGEVKIGNHCIIDSGASIGGEGFNFRVDEDGIAHRPFHAGGVVIGDYVEIGNGSAVDRGIFPGENTILEDYVKVDNLVHIGHDIKIGKNSMLAASCVIGGCTTIGKDVWIGIGATITDRITIGDEAEVLMGSVVTKNVQKGETVSGVYAMPNDAWLTKMKDDYKNYVLKMRKKKLVWREKLGTRL